MFRDPPQFPMCNVVSHDELYGLWTLGFRLRPWASGLSVLPRAQSLEPMSAYSCDADG
jgi:hypothetical protein